MFDILTISVVIVVSHRILRGRMLNQLFLLSLTLIVSLMKEVLIELQQLTFFPKFGTNQTPQKMYEAALKESSSLWLECLTKHRQKMEERPYRITLLLYLVEK